MKTARPRIRAAALALACATAACSTARTAPEPNPAPSPSVLPRLSSPPPGHRLVRDPAAGFGLAIPRTWAVYRQGDLPENVEIDPNAAVTVIAPDGSARITVARTPARDGEDIDIIARAGSSAIRAAYPQLDIEPARPVRLGGEAARELIARGPIDGTPYVVIQRLALHDGFVYVLTMAAPETSGVREFITAAGTFAYL